MCWTRAWIRHQAVREGREPYERFRAPDAHPFRPDQRMGTRSEPRRSASQGHRIRQEIHSGRVKPLLAGNTIGSDKKFLDHYMPELMENLHYRTIDVSTFKELARRWYPAVYLNRPPKNGATARSPTSSNRSTNCVTTARRSWPRCPVRAKRRRRPSPLKSRKPACSTRTDSTTPARGTA